MIKIKEKTEIPFFILFVLITLIMLIRALFGIEITDEAYYLAEGRTVLEGNLPYAFNNSRAVGMTIIMIPFIWFYRIIVQDYSGFFLYMRISFILFKSIIILVSYLLLKRKIGMFCSSCISLFMASYHMYSIQNFSYDTISTLMIFLVGILLFLLSDKESMITHKNIGYIVSGFLSAIAVFAHPAHAMSVMLFLIFLLVFRTKSHFIILYILGGTTQIIILFMSIIVQCGRKKLFSGLLWYMKNMYGIEHPFATTVINNILNEFSILWRTMFVFFILFFLIKMVVKKSNNIKNEVLNSLCFSLIIGLLYSLLKTNPQNTVAFIGACGAFVVLVLGLAFPLSKAFLFVGLPSLCFCILEAFMTNSSSAIGRFIHVVPAICSLYILYGEKNIRKSILNNSFRGRSIRQFFLPSLTIFLIILCEVNGLRYVYRDDDLKALTYRVTNGVFKGIYTSEQNAKDTMELEEYIKNITQKDDYIAFRDNVPVGYLFMNGHICDIRTWDCMQYTYGMNDPAALYSYYERREIIPDKIIYVDYGRDQALSIDKSDFLYNIFVKDNYTLESDIKFNDTYKRIMLFIKKQ